MMKPHLIAILLAVICVPLPRMIAAGPTHPTPETLRADENSLPFWISASAATSADGEVNYGVFDAGYREVVRSQAMPVRASVASTSAAEPCRQFTVSYSEAPAKAMTTWRNAVVNAATVVKGTITAVTPGFLSATPATMLTVRVEESLRRDGPLRNISEIFVPYLGANFRIGSADFCNAGLSRNGGPFLPSVNDDILIFVFAEPRGHYLSARDENLFFGRSDRLYVPRVFLTDTTLPQTSSFKTLMGRVRAEAGGPQSGREAHP